MLFLNIVHNYTLNACIMSEHCKCTMLYPVLVCFLRLVELHVTTETTRNVMLTEPSSSQLIRFLKHLNVPEVGLRQWASNTVVVISRNDYTVHIVTSSAVIQFISFHVYSVNADCRNQHQSVSTSSICY